jgi:putative ABC transport system permease protein
VARAIASSAERLNGVSGVEAVAAGCCVPMLGRYGLPFSIVGRPSATLAAGEAYVSPQYFDLFRIPLLRGRTFTSRDDPGAPGVVVINDVMARQLWPDRDPMLDRLQIGAGLGPEWADAPRRIIGVVADVRDGGLDRPPLPMMYVPVAQTSDALTAMHARVPTLWFVRTRTNPFALRSTIERELSAATGAPVAADFVRSVDQLVSESGGQQTFNTTLMTIFGAVALLLAGVGIYGVTGFLVQQRTTEIGIRLALGATSDEVRRMLAVQTSRTAIAGVGIGTAAAFGVARLVATMVFGITEHDPLTFAIVPCVLASVAFVSAWLPARRASRLDPAVCLRAE